MIGAGEMEQVERRRNKQMRQAHLIHAQALCNPEARQDAEDALGGLAVGRQVLAIHQHQARHLLLCLCRGPSHPLFGQLCYISFKVQREMAFYQGCSFAIYPD